MHFSQKTYLFFLNSITWASWITACANCWAILYAVPLVKSGASFLCCYESKLNFGLVNTSAKSQLLSITETNHWMVSAAAINEPVDWSISSWQAFGPICFSLQINVFIIESSSSRLSKNKNNPYRFLSLTVSWLILGQRYQRSLTAVTCWLHWKRRLAHNAFYSWPCKGPSSWPNKKSIQWTI